MDSFRCEIFNLKCRLFRYKKPMKEKKQFILVMLLVVFVMLGCSANPQDSRLKSDSVDVYWVGDGDQRDTYRASEGENTSLGENPTLSDYLRVAALNNAGLKAAFEKWKMAVEQVPQAQSLPDPKFTYGYFIE